MEKIKKLYNVSKLYLFPIILVAFALIKVNKGINLADTTYSLGNYRFFAQTEGAWFLLTFVANLAGYILTLLPGGATMLGIKIYTSLIVGAMGILGYRFFRTKMPAWLAFLAELLAVGMCWAPSVVLYHYLTYFFLLVGAIFLYRGLARDNNISLLIAGIVLGINALVRFPNNGLEVFLIIPLIMYGKLKKQDGKEIWKKVLICVGGYVTGFAVFMTLMSCIYGWDSFANLINGVLGISNSASDYTFTEMIKSIFNAYWHGFKWGIYIIICTLMGVPFFLLYEGKYMKLRKIVYCLCIAFLFFVLGRWGMFNYKYYQKESALQWGIIFLLISIGVNVWMIFTSHLSDDWRILGCISLINILITPLGSNNYVWPILNNLFFIAPITVWIIYRFARWGRMYLDMSKKVPLFAPKAMLMGCLIAFFIQAMGVGMMYIFVEGENGESVTAAVSDNDILTGMRTTSDNARSLSEISKYMKDNEASFGDRELILYGNIPGLSYILDRPSAISTTWPDLDSYPAETMLGEMYGIDATIKETRPIVILNRALYEFPDNSIKLNLVTSLVENYDYEMTFDNDAFVIFE